MPLATHEHGLPLGIQTMAKQANDGLLLQLAAQIERASGGKWNGGKKPAVHVTTA
jgi:Asp-tRNA(Asn)/Glu-tRNA(Gln) amidotransferase A subunit family amidase